MELKKLFALAILAGTSSLIAAEDKKEEGTPAAEATPAAEQPAEATPPAEEHKDEAK